MQRLIFLAFLLITATIAGKAQNGMISGVIIDGKTAETLIGANVLIKEKAGTGSSTDIDGRYKIDDLEPGTYTVEISYISYDTKTVPGVEVKPGQVTSLDVTLTSGLMELTVVEVKARPRQESLNTVLAFQQKNIAPSEVISRDIITSTPDKNTGEVLKRMSGTTITDGKFVVIRGLSDRYNLALVNGNLLPSTEPDRKTFAFDLFPSAMLDNLIVIKAAQPNLPGDFAGGIIILNTRDIPDKPFISISAGAGYNTISTFKEYYTYTGGKTDWLGIDDGTRQLPAGFPVSQDLFDDLT
ncbi:MAG TPA: carboxypeptidase-like regulatory domain-containing protein, partial [Chitinophagales bacterium]|nr:carboxypeptidase-like regulatory domain-containing protein [Chitinophagales bacterium]